jgi:hypothetical protein
VVPARAGCGVGHAEGAGQGCNGGGFDGRRVQARTQAAGFDRVAEAQPQRALQPRGLLSKPQNGYQQQFMASPSPQPQSTAYPSPVEPVQHQQQQPPQ